MDRKTRTNELIEILNIEGFRAKIDEDENVEFKFEGATFLLMVDDREFDLLRVIYPGFWKIEEKSDRLDALELCNTSNSENKLSKLYLEDEYLVGSVELLMLDDKSALQMIERALAALKFSANEFVALTREQSLNEKTVLKNS